MTGYYTKMPNLYISNEAQSFALVSLSSAETSLCCGKAGEKEKESARGTMGRRTREESSRFPELPIVPRALSIFFDYCYCYRDTQREPLRRTERWFHHEKKICLSKSDESITTSDEEHKEIQALFNGEMHTEVKNDDDDEHTFLESKSGENWNLPQEEKKISISDHQIKNLQVKKPNKLLRNFSTEEREKIRRRRRSLKTRGCAKTCCLSKQQVLNLVVN